MKKNKKITYVVLVVNWPYEIYFATAGSQTNTQCSREKLCRRLANRHNLLKILEIKKKKLKTCKINTNLLNC